MRIPISKLLEILETVYFCARMNKVRFLFMLFSMTVGVFTLTTIFIISDVGKKIIYTELQSFGINRVWAYRDLNDFLNDPNTNPWTSNRQISNEDVVGITRSCKHIRRTAPSIWWNVPVIYQGRVLEGVRAIATVPDWVYIQNEHIEKGRFLTPVDGIRRNLVCVLSHEAHKSIFGNAEALGNDLQITNEYFTVVGILEKKDRPFLESINIIPGREEVIFIPLEVMQSQSWYNTNNVQYVDFQIDTFDNSEKAAYDIESYLQIQHGTEPQFRVKMLYTKIRIAQRIMRTLSIVLGTIASVALLIAGTGIMNMMLSSVTERFFEIGIRRAVGATRKDILFQFIIESIAIGLSGGIIGILGGVGVYHLSLFWLGACKVSLLPAILIASAVSIMTGLLAGIYPAQKAANLNPIDALRNA